MCVYILIRKIIIRRVNITSIYLWILELISSYLKLTPQCVHLKSDIQYFTMFIARCQTVCLNTYSNVTLQFDATFCCLGQFHFPFTSHKIFPTNMHMLNNNLFTINRKDKWQDHTFYNLMEQIIKQTIHRRTVCSVNLLYKFTLENFSPLDCISLDI